MECNIVQGVVPSCCTAHQMLNVLLVHGEPQAAADFAESIARRRYNHGMARYVFKDGSHLIQRRNGEWVAALDPEVVVT